MKRAPIVLTGTALGLGAVLGYHTESTHSTVVSAAAGSATTQTRSAASSSTASTSTATTTTSATTSSASPSANTRTATGEDVSSRYGDVQVKVTMSGSHITAISVVSLNVTDPRSDSIDQVAIPDLRQQAISAQSAKIDGVAGASYTSQAYEQSLQSALDKLGATSASA